MSSNMMCGPPGSNTKVSPAAISKPPSFSCIDIWPSSFIRTSCSSTVSLTEAVAEIAVIVSSV